jgi:hypothetical protein
MDPSQLTLSPDCFLCLKRSDSFTIYAKLVLVRFFFYFLLKNSVPWCQVGFGNVRPFLSELLGEMFNLIKFFSYQKDNLLFPKGVGGERNF